MSKPTKAEDFLRAMSAEGPTDAPAITATKPPPAVAAIPVPVKEAAISRVGLKHIGGYFDSETTEQVAILRARLKLDNSQLLKLAIEELYRKHAAKRSFGDS